MLMPIGQMILVQRRRPAEHGARDERDRRPDHPRPGLRPHARRPAARARRLAVDLLRQRPDRHRRRASPRCACCRATTPRRARPASSTPSASRSSPPASSASPTAWPRAAPPARLLAATCSSRSCVGIALIAAFVIRALQHRQPAARRPPVRQQGLRRRVGDDVLPRRRAVRRDDPDAAVLPDRPRRGRRPHRPAARSRRASAPRSRWRSPAASPSASAAA